MCYTCINYGHTSTVCRGLTGGQRAADAVCFASESSMMDRWWVLVSFKRLLSKWPSLGVHIPALSLRVELRKGEHQGFVEALGVSRATLMSTSGGDSVAANTVMNMIGTFCEASMLWRIPRHVKLSVYWWMVKIVDLRKKCHRFRRFPLLPGPGIGMYNNDWVLDKLNEDLAANLSKFGTYSLNAKQIDCIVLALSSELHVIDL